MAKSVFRTVLVVGDNHEEIIKKYSADTKVEPHVKYHYDDAEKLRQKHLEFIECVLNSDKLSLTNSQKDLYKELYLTFSDMSDFEYYQYITKGCKYDEETGDAYTTENPDAYYKSEKCYDHRLKKYGEEAPFSNPFKLKDGTLAYSARKKDIDWEKNHMYNTEIYKAAWELIVDDREPENEQEKQIKANMENRKEYFLNFDNKDEYIRHSCSFWTYGIAFEDKYIEVDYHIRDKEWVATFFDKYIEPLDDDTLLTIYEVRCLADY